MTSARGRQGPLVAAIVVLGVLNRVLYKIMLVPMRDYPYVISQFVTFGYVFVYFSILFARRKAGIVTPHMMSVPKMRFVLIGFFEAAAYYVGVVSAARIPGTLLPILSQMGLPSTMLLSAVLLKISYSRLQFIGAALVVAGATAAVSTTTTVSAVFDMVDFPAASALAYAASGVIGSLAFVAKEMAFADSHRPDVFVVNSFGSLFQCLWIFVLMLMQPAVSMALGRVLPASVSLPNPEAASEGAKCLAGATPGVCADTMPWLALGYVTVNLGWNIAILTLVKVAGATLSFVAVTVSIPLTYVAFCLPLPLLHAADATVGSVVGLVLVVAGLVAFQRESAHAAPQQKPGAPLDGGV